MARIQAVDSTKATGKTKEVLDTVNKKMGRVPNIFQLMANSPAAVDAYLKFSGALAEGTLDPKTRELISITVAEINICEYCLSAHTAIGKMVGLSDEELKLARSQSAKDKKADEILSFVHNLILRRGDVSDADMESLREVGVTDGEIAEIVANVALNEFTNYFNLVAKTEVDFPKVPVSFPA